MRWLFDYSAKFWKFCFLFTAFFHVFLHVFCSYINRLWNNVILIFLNFDLSTQIIFFFKKKKSFRLSLFIHFSYFKTIPSLMGLCISLSHPDSAHPQWQWPFPCHHPPHPPSSFPECCRSFSDRGSGGVSYQVNTRDQGSHHHLAILKKFNTKYNKQIKNKNT